MTTLGRSITAGSGMNKMQQLCSVLAQLIRHHGMTDGVPSSQDVPANASEKLNKSIVRGTQG
jgi:hypothetical protein